MLTTWEVQLQVATQYLCKLSCNAKYGDILFCAEAFSFRGGLCPGSLDPLSGTWSPDPYKDFVLDSTGGEPSDPALRAKTKVGVYEFFRLRLVLFYTEPF